MHGNLGEPVLVDTSLWAYQLLIRLYPASFRQVYGPHMQQVFRDCCRRAWRQGGTMALLLLWVNTLFDTLKTLIEEHLEGATDMNESKFIRLSGVALLLGGLALGLGTLGLFLMDNNLGSFDLGTLFTTPQLETGIMALFLLGFLPVAIGLYGLYRRLKTRGSSGINQGLLLAAAGAAGCSLGFVLIALEVGDSGWAILSVALPLVLVPGLVIFGVSLVRQGFSQMSGWLALLAAATLFLGSMGLAVGPLLQSTLLFCAFFCLAVLGLVQVASPFAQPEAAA